MKILLYSLPPTGGDLFPVSQGYIAASLRAAGFDCALGEVESLSTRTGQEVANFVISYKPRIVSFCVYQANIKVALQLSRLVKMIDPAIVIVFGGPQVTFMPSAALRQMPNVDVLVRGEGETVMPALASCLRRNGDISKVRGICFLSRGRIHDIPSAPLTRDLDRFPSPYTSGVFDLTRHATAAMLTSRGCPYACRFCYTPEAFKRSFRTHSVARVLKDMAACIDAGIEKFFFADPSFTVDRRRAASIMRGIIRMKWKVQIWCETRDDLVDHALLALMSKAGVRRIAFGLESIDPAVNRAIGKRIDPASFAEKVRRAQSLGMEVEVFTQCGLPFQSKESCLRTVGFLKGLGISLRGNSGGQQMNLFFGTEFTRRPASFGIRVERRKRPAYLSPGTEFSTRWMTRQDIASVLQRYRKTPAAGRKAFMKKGSISGLCIGGV